MIRRSVWQVPQDEKARFPSSGSQKEAFTHDVSTLDQSARTRIYEGFGTAPSRTSGEFISDIFNMIFT